MGALCHFGEEIKTQNFNIYNIKEVIIQTQRRTFFPFAILREGPPEHSLMHGRWQGTPHINKVKQHVIMSVCLVTLLSRENRESFLSG